MRRLIAAVLLSLLFCPSARAQTAQANEATYGTTWSTLKIGGGGFVTGIDIASDGTKVVRTDTYGAWLYNIATNLWQQLVTTSSMPVGDFGVQLGVGVYEIAIAPSNTRRFYMMFNGYVYRSDDRGTTWTRTGFAHVAGCDPNDGNRTYGRKMAVDPNNANVVYVGTALNGLFVSGDAGATWSPVGGVAKGATTAGIVVAFDPSSRVVAGRTQTIYASSYGNGVYRTTDGGTNWSLTPRTPTTHIHMIVAQDGAVYLTDNSDGSRNVNRFAGDGWLQLDAGKNNWSVAVDPSNANRIVVGMGSGNLKVSTDHGASWTGPLRQRRTAIDVPWLAWTNEDFMSNADQKFDPSASNRLYFAEGIGVWYGSPSSNSTVTWTSQSATIEQLVPNWIISPPNGNPILTGWDRPVWTVGNPDVYPSRHGLNNANQIVHGWSADWASSSPSTIVVVANVFGGIDTSGYSSDGGATWKLFGSNAPATTNATAGGCIAASTPTNFVWVPMDNNPKPNTPWYTTDGGISWKPVTISGVPKTGTGWGFAFYLNRQICAADRVNANTFYLYNDGSGSARAAGIYQSTDGGATWSHVYARSFPNSGYSAQMRSVPEQAGHLFFTSGTQSAPHPAEQAFYRSTDGGKTWNVVPDVKEVFSFGFGKAPPGRSYPAIFIYGWVNRVLGIWRSDDNASTWKQMSNGFPLGIFAPVKAVEGDNNIHGMVYVGFSGSGFAYGRFDK